jgi:hypothetical protein
MSCIIRNFQSKSVWLLLQVWSNSDCHFHTQNNLLGTSLRRSLGTCQLLLISCTGILIIGWILLIQNTSKNYQHHILTPSELALKLQEFEWTLVQCHCPNPKKAPPTWTRAYTRLGFTNAEKRLFGEGNCYKVYIETFWGMLGFHQIRETNTPGPKNFATRQKSLESNYNPQHIYLLRGQGLLW